MPPGELKNENPLKKLAELNKKLLELRHSPDHKKMYSL